MALKEEKDRTVRLMGNLSSAAVIFGLILVALTSVFFFANRRLDCTSALLFCSVGVFFAAVGVGVRRSYGVKGTGLTTTTCSIGRIRRDSEIMAARPVAYFLLSSAVLLLCSASLVYGDLRLESELWMFRKRLMGDNWIHAATSVVFVMTSLIGLLLALTKSMKQLKAVLATYVVSNMLGFFAASCLIGLDNNALSRGRRSTLLEEQVEFHKHSSSSTRPQSNIVKLFINLLVLKFSPVDILCIFCLVNFMSALDLLWTYSKKDYICKQQTNACRMRILGATGLVMLAAGVSIDIARITMQTLDRNPLVALESSALLLMLTGLQMSLCFHSMGKFRQLLLFFLGLAVKISCIITLVMVLSFHQSSARGQELALRQDNCFGKVDDPDTFCVFNSTTNDFQDLRKSLRKGCKAGGDACNKEHPPLTCIPASKVCDLEVDLAMEQEWKNRRWPNK